MDKQLGGAERRRVDRLRLRRTRPPNPLIRWLRNPERMDGLPFAHEHSVEEVGGPGVADRNSVEATTHHDSSRRGWESVAGSCLIYGPACPRSGTGRQLKALSAGPGRP